ncbi:DUF4919 domain-containing protein [Fibrobacter sp. UWR2]|uniref:DUF4919 domain-containing protein n=1 Tax=Fibrobacter sp. UWR2 TaxID=1964352 RepID=UPI000B5248CB|nr:DUF4919 domain-containing protein [Fibrobacter sp. UWR2]OWV00991.1 hypothetical protein B7994_04190 [Fibrobacter sp. UWR2]
MSKIKVILISLSVWMLAACAGSRGPATLPSGEPAYDDAAIEASYYMQQLKVIKKDSLKAVETTDWLKFRKEFLKCKLSQPKRFGITGQEAVMNLARKNGDSKQELKVAQELLDVDFTNISAHYAIVSNPSTDTTVKEFHKQIIMAILNSIRNSGKGTSPQNAMYVINIGEEYDFILLGGLKPTGQALVEENGRQYDLMKAVDEEGRNYQFYFDVTDFFGHY